MERAELIEKAKEVFAFHKNEKKLFATSDGNFFLESAKSLAIDHARTSGGKLMEILRSEAEQTEDEKTAQAKAKTEAKAAQEVAEKKAAQAKAETEAKAAQEEAEKKAEAAKVADEADSKDAEARAKTATNSKTRNKANNSKA